MGNTQLSVNIFLTEQFFGRCWHEWAAHTRPTSTTFTCKKCKHSVFVYSGEVHYAVQPDQNLFTPEGFFLLWEKAQKEKWWLSKPFFHWLGTHHPEVMLGEYKVDMNLFINPLTFPTLLATYLGWQE